jgi:hypothetical protein
MNAEDLADRLAITDQTYRYCRSVVRLDVPLGGGGGGRPQEWNSAR